MFRSILIVGGTIAVGLGLVGVWALVSLPPADERGPITYVEDPGEVGAYVQLDRLGIATAENFVGHRIRVIEGTLINTGAVQLRSVELHLAFQDSDQTTVLESEGEALRSPLPPDETRRYEFRFENLPPEWNYRIPVVSVSRVGY